MPDNYGFFNAEKIGGVYDRTYYAQDFATCMRGLVTDGVIGVNPTSPGLKVTKVSGADSWKVKVAPGYSWTRGYWFETTENIVVEIEPADPIYYRLDAIVVRLDYDERKIMLMHKMGTPGATQTEVDYQDDEHAFEMPIALISIPPGSESIQDAAIIDDRKFAHTNMTPEALGGLFFVRCTQEEYDAMSTHDEYTVYIIVG